MTKEKKNRKFSYVRYVWLTIIGVILIGLGCGISVFEFSEYKMANYRAVPVNPNLPQLETETFVYEATYESGQQFKLDANLWDFHSYDIQHDNTLGDKVIIEVIAPKGLYDVYLSQFSENHYRINGVADVFQSLHFALELTKDGYMSFTTPPLKMTLTMSEAQAKNFKLNEELYRAQDLETEYRERLNLQRTEYTDQLNQQRIEYTDQLNQTRAHYEEASASLQEDYDTQLADIQQQYEERIAELEAQLENVRKSLDK